MTIISVKDEDNRKVISELKNISLATSIGINNICGGRRFFFKFDKFDIDIKGNWDPKNDWEHLIVVVIFIQKYLNQLKMNKVNPHSLGNTFLFLENFCLIRNINYSCEDYRNACYEFIKGEDINFIIWKNELFKKTC